ncbi:hypothetical protein TeGR_g4315, partial [Tetraparma gracilis]
YLIIILLYYKSCIGSIPSFFPSGWFPFVLVVYTIKCLVTPWRIRRGLWGTIKNVLLSPYEPATFFGTYVADVFTSMVKIWQDLAWTVCYFASGNFLDRQTTFFSEQKEHWQASVAYVNVLIPLICLLPIWFRLMQCLRRYHDTRLRWPNLANAAKYSLAQIVTLFGTFHPLFMFNNAKMRVAGHNEVNDVGGMFQVFWVSIFICSSVYSSCWDVFMDWGLGRVEYKGLGPRLMFPAIWWYYVAIVVDVILRFLWVTSLVPPDSGAQFSLPNYLTSAVMALEILRRTVWGFLRLEQEHRHNTEGYRRVDFVPLHFNTGHEHDRAGADKINKGKGVLGEVLTIGGLVIVVSIGSIIAAQRQGMEESELYTQHLHEEKLHALLADDDDL